jgi:hypothetical protein
MNYTNTDSFGNSYLNGFSKNLAPSEYYSYRDSQTGGYHDFLTSVYGASRYWRNTEISSSNTLHFLFDHPSEGNITPNGTISRFRLLVATGVGSNPQINKDYSGTETFITSTMNFAQGNSFFPGPFMTSFNTATGTELINSSSYRTFVVASRQNINICKTTLAMGDGGKDTGFVSLGWLDDPIPFSASSPYRTSTAYILATRVYSANTNNSFGPICYYPESEVSGFNSVINGRTSGEANYSVTCATGGPSTSTWATNLVLIDSTASPQNYARGSVRNMLLGKGTYTVGSVYKITNNVGVGQANATPNTEVQFYMCVGPWGANWLLMRVWTEGYTI